MSDSTTLDDAWGRIAPMCEKLARRAAEERLAPADMATFTVMVAGYFFTVATGAMHHAIPAPQTQKLPRTSVARLIADRLVAQIASGELH